MIRRPLGLLALGAVVAASGLLVARRAPDRFDHGQHAGLFPTCEGCHAPTLTGTGVAMPAAAACEACHDGTAQPTVEWQPAWPEGSNLRFTHDGHAVTVREAVGGDSTLACLSCHQAEGGGWMAVRAAEAPTCLACHGVEQEHLELAGESCAACHVTLAQATRLPDDRIQGFRSPSSHDSPGFAQAGHGPLATATDPVDQSCATCHAREYCMECHVNAAEVAAVQALGVAPRSLLVPVALEAPASHASVSFLNRHGANAITEPGTCRTCHTQESCLNCHVGQPAVAQALLAAGPGRGTGASTARTRPASHGQDFGRAHAQDARSAPSTCASCHLPETCLDCHRPGPADARFAVGPVDRIDRGYHPVAFLARHPASAYAQETECADCHNTAAFCTDCHANAGLRGQGALRPGYHDATPFFMVGHGQAARQSLESCVSCHVEQDCLTCHSAYGGRGFNPHGPGFEAERLRRRNPSMCAACHGNAIPG